MAIATQAKSRKTGCIRQKKKKDGNEKMRKSTKGKTVRMLLLAALLLVCVAGKPVCAASTLPTTGSITIQLTTELGTSKEGGRLQPLQGGKLECGKRELAAGWQTLRNRNCIG